MNQKKTHFRRAAIWAIMILLPLAVVNSSWGATLQEIKERGLLRHLGIPYGNFVTGSGDGLDVELVKLFAQSLGVDYQYVEATWDSVIGDLTGKRVKVEGDKLIILGEVPIKGDIIANGYTMLGWRKKIVDFSIPTFPDQIWLVARADSTLKPIIPQDTVEKDIASVKALLKGRSLLGRPCTCTDPSLYSLKKTGVRIKFFPGNLNDLAPAIIKGEAELTLLDVPDALVALEKFPGKIKVIGPITDRQYIGCAFAKNSPELREAFNRFLEKAEADGTYQELVRRYYPKVFNYFRDFFEKK
jgi:ABC-type amino acid transport substrate-binding protein